MRQWTENGFELGFEDKAKAEELIPGYLVEGMLRYVEHGTPPGHFLSAVLSNDLFEAMKHGDVEALAGLHNICVWLYNYVPSECYGSRKNYANWIAKHVKLRTQGLAAIEKEEDKWWGESDEVSDDEQMD